MKRQPSAYGLQSEKSPEAPSSSNEEPDEEGEGPLEVTLPQAIYPILNRYYLKYKAAKKSVGKVASSRSARCCEAKMTLTKRNGKASQFDWQQLGSTRLLPSSSSHLSRATRLPSSLSLAAPCFIQGDSGPDEQPRATLEW